MQSGWLAPSVLRARFAAKCNASEPDHLDDIREHRCISSRITPLQLGIGTMSSTPKTHPRSSDIKLKANSIVILAFVAGILVPLQANAEVPPEMKVLGRFVGTWKVEQTRKTADGREVKAKGLTSSKMVLGGRFLEYIGITNPGEQEAYSLFTYDEAKKKYRSWFFDSKGSHSEWSGTWDEATKTLTRTANNLSRGNTGTAISKFLDDDTVEFSLILKHRDGKVFLEMDSKMTRQPNAKPVVRKKSKERSASPPELKTLERMVGKWSDEGVMKAAVWTPEEVRFKSDSEKFWILGGKCVFSESKNAIFLRTYSAAEKAVKMWHFNAAGYVHEWTGNWDDGKKTLTLKTDLDGNPTVSSVFKHTLTDKETISWSAIATDRTGKVYHNVEGLSKRRD